MKKVIDRLKAEDTLKDNPLYQSGREAGEEWAKLYAKPYQLRRFGRYVNSFGPSFEAVVDHLTSRVFFELIEATEADEYSDHDKFWESVFGSDRHQFLVDDRDVMRGFADGAYGVYREVCGAMGWD